MAEGLRLLAVEDQPANVALLRAVLGRSSAPELSAARLAVAETLAEARAQLAAEPFDVILLDVRLPDGNGLDLALELTARPQRPRIVVLTANALPGDETAARDAGADAFIPKPYQPSLLVATLLDLASAAPPSARG